MVIKNCEDKYTYLFRVTKGLKTINAKTTTFSGSRFLVVFLILNSLDQCTKWLGIPVITRKRRVVTTSRQLPISLSTSEC